MSAIVEKVTDAAAAAVDQVANTLAKTSITDKDAKDAKDSKESKDAKDPAATDAAVLASAAERRRLYIGNLAYATDEGGLKEFFKGYLVETVFIPKNPRTERPVGYAFVDLSTPTEAERAIAELSGKEILERKVSVQLARTPEPEKKDASAGGENGENGTQRRGSTRGRGRSGRGRGGRARGGRGGMDENRADGAAHGEESHPANGEVHALKDITNEKATDNKDKGGKAPRPPRERRERGPPADGIPSKTKVMVANLPYDLSEDKLKELFETYSPLSAKIALRPIPRFMIKKLQARGEPRKGRGFGFVTMASEELQLKAVSEMNGKEIEGREIAVKVAIDSPDKTDDDVVTPTEAKADAPVAPQEPAAAPVEAAA